MEFDTDGSVVLRDELFIVTAQALGLVAAAAVVVVVVVVVMVVVVQSGKQGDRQISWIALLTPLHTHLGIEPPLPSERELGAEVVPSPQL